MIGRKIKDFVELSLQKSPAIALLGARQIGKTTLSLEIKKSFNRQSIYLDLEKPSDLSKLSDPEYFLNQHLDKLLILDEAQRLPEILPILRSVIDQRRCSGDLFGQYLLLGSSSKTLLSRSSESLAGRIRYIDMCGFNLLEVESSNLNNLWVRGGFPESYLLSNAVDSFSWRENMIRTYLEREVYFLGLKIDTQILRRFWMMLAHNQGELFNGSKIAASLGISTPSVFRYLDILHDLFMIRILQPWYHNSGKRLVKTPKIYIRDSGILHCLLGIKTLDDVLSHPISGCSFEGFVIENIKSIMSISQQMWFYRTSAGAEMDLVIEGGRNRIGIEIKRSLSPTPSKGLYNAIDDLNLDKAYIIYPGDHSYALNSKIFITSLTDMMNHEFFRQDYSA